MSGMLPKSKVTIVDPCDHRVYDALQKHVMQVPDVEVIRSGYHARDDGGDIVQDASQEDSVDGVGGVSIGAHGIHLSVAFCLHLPGFDGLLNRNFYSTKVDDHYLYHNSYAILRTCQSDI